MKTVNIDHIKNILSSPDVQFPPDTEKRFSSVLMILKEINNELGIYFIRRAEFPNDKFSGHIAFPGGKRKKTDINPLATAARETFEEIGVDINTKGEIIGKLDIVNPFTPEVSHFLVCPFVALMHENTEFTMNYEVDEIFWVPISHLYNGLNQDIRYRNRNGVELKDYIFRYKNYIIWGLTGRILNQFFCLLSK